MKSFCFENDAKGALFDSAVKGIRLFNYKILSDTINLEGRKKVWWLSDRLTEENGDYLLEIDLLVLIHFFKNLPLG